MSWLRVLEAYMVQALLRTPGFHRGVEKVVRQVHRIRHGLPPEEMGGTEIDQPDGNSFLKHFTDELQTQLGSKAESKGGETAVKSTGQNTARLKTAEAVEDASADAVWRNTKQNAEQAQKEVQGFMGEYMDALREQVKRGR